MNLGGGSLGKLLPPPPIGKPFPMWREVPEFFWLHSCHFYAPTWRTNLSGVFFGRKVKTTPFLVFGFGDRDRRLVLEKLWREALEEKNEIISVQFFEEASEGGVSGPDP